MNPSCHSRPQPYLAGEDVAKGGEGVVQGLVVNGLVQVLDEHVAHAGLPEGGVSLGPHDADGLPFHHVKVHGVQGSLGWGGGGGGGGIVGWAEREKVGEFGRRRESENSCGSVNVYRTCVCKQIR